jgi:hypothetical protein
MKRNYGHIWSYQFKLLTSSQHYNYSRQRVCGITVNVSFIFPKQVRKFITHYSLLITHYSEYKHPDKLFPKFLTAGFLRNFRDMSTKSSLSSRMKFGTHAWDARICIQILKIAFVRAGIDYSFNIKFLKM